MNKINFCMYSILLSFSFSTAILSMDELSGLTRSLRTMQTPSSTQTQRPVISIDVNACNSRASAVQAPAAQQVAAVQVVVIQRAVMNSLSGFRGLTHSASDQALALELSSSRNC